MKKCSFHLLSRHYIKGNSIGGMTSAGLANIGHIKADPGDSTLASGGATTT